MANRHRKRTVRQEIRSTVHYRFFFHWPTFWAVFVTVSSIGFLFLALQIPHGLGVLPPVLVLLAMIVTMPRGSLRRR